MLPVGRRVPANASICCSASRRSATDRDSALGGLSAASLFRNRSTLASSGMCAAPSERGAEAQRTPTIRGPLGHGNPADAEHGNRHAIHAEGHTGSVRDLAAGGRDTPDVPEMLLVIIEAHAGGGRGTRM